MVRIFLVLVLLIASFAGGMYVEKISPGEEGSLKQQVQDLEAQLEEAKTRSTELNETLQLVKRQIQTDRIAYQALQQSVEDSEQERQALREKLDSQRELLKKLRDRLESLEQ